MCCTSSITMLISSLTAKLSLGKFCPLKKIWKFEEIKTFYWEEFVPYQVICCHVYLDGPARQWLEEVSFVRVVHHG